MYYLRRICTTEPDDLHDSVLRTMRLCVLKDTALELCSGSEMIPKICTFQLMLHDTALGSTGCTFGMFLQSVDTAA